MGNTFNKKSKLKRGIEKQFPKYKNKQLKRVV